MSAFDAVIVGGGPRGVATVLRTVARLRTVSRPCADAASGTRADQDTDADPVGPVDGTGDRARRPLRLALVDARDVGAGATWLLDQPAAYLNNTQARATTIHPDDTTPMSGPPAPGPDLVAWARAVAERGTHSAGDWVVREAAMLAPESFPSRRLQGAYFRDQLDAAITSGLVEVEEVLGTAVDLEHEGADRVVVLADGRRLAAPTVVLAQGMVQSRPGAEVTALAEAAGRLSLRYVPPGMPAERDYTDLPAGQDVLVRGLGANFFDVIGQLVVEWGGRFEPAGSDAAGHAEPAGSDPTGRLRYRPSGREPRLVVGSRRCLPYRSKPDGGMPTRPFTPRWATPAVFEDLAGQRGVDFRDQVWPLMAAEFARVYLEALSEHAPGAVDGGWLAELDALVERAADLGTASGPAPGPDGGESGPPVGSAPVGRDDVGAGAQALAAIDGVLTCAITDARWSWTIEELHHLTHGQAVTTAQWQQVVARLVEDELGSLSAPDTHPRAAVNGAMGSLRVQVAHLVAAGALAGQSLARDVLGWFDGDSLALASGPPAHRVRRVLALIEAGVIDLLGPGFAVTVDEAEGCFVATSPITGRTARSRVLLETRMSKGMVPATSDPLLQSLLATGGARIHTVDGIPTHSMEATGAVVSEDVTGGHNLVGRDGTVDAGVVVLGIPAQSTQPGSAIGASPGVPSPLLAGADIAAKQILARVPAEAACGGSRRVMAV